MAKKKTLGKRIRELRLMKKMTQVELAKKTRINPTYLSKIENDRLNIHKGPSEKVIKKFAENLTDKEHIDELYEDLMFLAGKVPETLKKDVLQYQTDYRLLFSEFKEQLEMQDFTQVFRELQRQIDQVSKPLMDSQKAVEQLIQPHSKAMEHMKLLASDLATQMARQQFNLMRHVAPSLKSVSRIYEQFQKAMLPSITACSNLLTFSSYWDRVKAEWLPHDELNKALQNLSLHQDYMREVTAPLAAATQALKKKTFSNLAITGIVLGRYTDSLKSPEFYQLNTEYMYEIESQMATGGNLPEMIDEELYKISPSLVNLRRGSWDAFHSNSRDGLGQSIHSIRQLLYKVIRLPSDEEIMSSPFYDPQENQGKLTRRMRIYYMLGEENSEGLIADIMVASIIRIIDLLSKYEHVQQEPVNQNRENIRAILCAAESMIYFLLVNSRKRRF